MLIKSPNLLKSVYFLKLFISFQLSCQPKQQQIEFFVQRVHKFVCIYFQHRLNHLIFFVCICLQHCLNHLTFCMYLFSALFESSYFVCNYLQYCLTNLCSGTVKMVQLSILLKRFVFKQTSLIRLRYQNRTERFITQIVHGDK